MISAYIQEQRYYTMDELVERFSFKGVAVEKDRVLNIWHRLASKGLAKFVKKEARDKDLTELAQADDVILKDSAAMALSLIHI